MTDLEALRRALRTYELCAAGWLDPATVIAEGRRLRWHRRAAVAAVGAAALVLAVAAWSLWDQP